MKLEEFEEKKWKYIMADQNSGCWIWTGAAGRGDRYGFVAIGLRHMLVHRAAWEIHTGRKIPPGMQIDHLCKTKLCINPNHLEVVTPLENTRRIPFEKTIKARTKCAQGHPLAGSNVRLYHRIENGKLISRRDCKVCCALRARQLRERRGANPDHERRSRYEQSRTR